MYPRRSGGVNPSQDAESNQFLREVKGTVIPCQIVPVPFCGTPEELQVHPVVPINQLIPFEMCLTVRFKTVGVLGQF